MSRLKVHGLDNYSVGEFGAILPRGFAVDGSRSVSGGSQTSVSVGADVASKRWLQFGRMVSSKHPKLPLLWAGMIDPPWGATLPVTITIYNPSYLISLRSPDAPEILKGDVYSIVGQMIERINAQQEMFLRLGNTSGVDIARQETLDQRTFWEQMNALVARAGKEMYIRPEEVNGQLLIYVDVQDRVGIDTGFLLHDGDNANIQVLNPTIDGKIINRLIGIGSQSTTAGRLATPPQITQASIDAFRLRSAVKQYQNVADDTTLLTNTQNDLAYSSWPPLKIPIKILDVEDTFSQVKPGNSYILQAGNVYLPGGVKGYRGSAHLTSLAYDETDESVSGLMEVAYAPR